MLECGGCCVPESESSDYDIPETRLQFTESKVCERNFHFVEQARHQKRLAELDFVDLTIAQGGDLAAPQNQIAQRSFLEIEFLESFAHRRSIAAFRACTIGRLRQSEARPHWRLTFDKALKMSVATTGLWASLAILAALEWKITVL